MTTPDPCNARYPSTDRTARIVHCDLPAGHDGDHEETDTESTWPQAQPRLMSNTPATFWAARERAAYERGKAEGIAEGEAERAELRGALEETRLLLEQAEQHARDTQDELLPEVEAEAYARGLAEGRRLAIAAVRAQASLPDLMHFDRPSDFRKGVLSCLAALEAQDQERKPSA